MRSWALPPAHCPVPWLQTDEQGANKPVPGCRGGEEEEEEEDDEDDAILVAQPAGKGKGQGDGCWARGAEFSAAPSSETLFLLFAASQMEIKKPFILSSMKLPLQDSNDKVSSLLLRMCLGAEVFPGPCPAVPSCLLLLTHPLAGFSAGLTACPVRALPVNGEHVTTGFLSAPCREHS